MRRLDGCKSGFASFLPAPTVGSLVSGFDDSSPLYLDPACYTGFQDPSLRAALLTHSTLGVMTKIPKAFVKLADFSQDKSRYKGFL